MDVYTATCHTPRCENADIPIVVGWDPEWGSTPSVTCGVCGEPITDLPERTSDGDEELRLH